MIWLTKSALRYAADLCSEVENYIVTVYVARAATAAEMQNELIKSIRNRQERIVAGAISWHADYRNGSTIRVVVANEAARGIRCHLAIASKAIDRRVIDEIIRPSELLVDPIPEPEQRLELWTPVREEFVPTWEELPMEELPMATGGRVDRPGNRRGFVPFGDNAVEMVAPTVTNTATPDPTIRADRITGGTINAQQVLHATDLITDIHVEANANAPTAALGRLDNTIDAMAAAAGATITAVPIQDGLENQIRRLIHEEFAAHVMA